MKTSEVIPGPSFMFNGWSTGVTFRGVSYLRYAVWMSNIFTGCLEVRYSIYYQQLYLENEHKIL